MAEDDTLNGTEELAVGTKDWADVILAMRQSAVDRFNSRRNLEWKLSFTLWGAVALSANVLRFVEVDGSLRALLLVGGTAIIGMHAWLAHAFYTGGRRATEMTGSLWTICFAHTFPAPCGRLLSGLTSRSSRTSFSSPSPFCWCSSPSLSPPAPRPARTTACRNRVSMRSAQGGLAAHMAGSRRPRGGSSTSRRRRYGRSSDR